MIKQVAIVIGWGLAFLFVQPAWADDEWDALEAEYDQAYDEWQEAMGKLKGDDGAMKFNPMAMPPHPIERFRVRFRTYAEMHEGKLEALPALGHLMSGGFSIMGGKDASAQWALAQLEDSHAARPQIREYVGQARQAVMFAGEESVIAFMAAVAEKNPDREIRARAKLALAEVLYEGSPFAMMMRGMNESAETKGKKERAVGILRDVRKEFAGTDIAEQADAFLFAIEKLRVGMEAPEVVGKDTNGVDIRLSAFEGKVVAVVFWATWCAPCMQMIPHERELMAKHAGKPFTILGINVDESVGDCKAAMRKERITWPTIFDGAPGMSSIRQSWRINAFPTIYVIDHKGVIRYKNLQSFQLEGAVDELVAEAVEDDKTANGDG